MGGSSGLECGFREGLASGKKVLVHKGAGHLYPLSQSLAIDWGEGFVTFSLSLCPSAEDGSLGNGGNWVMGHNAQGN